MRSVRKYEAMKLKICVLILFLCLNKYTITLTPRTWILISDKWDSTQGRKDDSVGLQNHAILSWYLIRSPYHQFPVFFRLMSHFPVKEIGTTGNKKHVSYGARTNVFHKYTPSSLLSGSFSFLTKAASKLVRFRKRCWESMEPFSVTLYLATAWRLQIPTKTRRVPTSLERTALLMWNRFM